MVQCIYSAFYPAEQSSTVQGQLALMGRSGTGEGRDWGRMRRFYEIVAKLRKLLKTLL